MKSDTGLRGFNAALCICLNAKFQVFEFHAVFEGVDFPGEGEFCVFARFHD